MRTTESRLPTLRGNENEGARVMTCTACLNQWVALATVLAYIDGPPH